MYEILSHSLIHSLDHSLTWSLTRSLIHSFTHSITHLLDYSLTHYSLTHSLHPSLTSNSLTASLTPSYWISSQLASESARCDYGLFVGASADNSTVLPSLAAEACGLKMYLNDTFSTLKMDNTEDWMKVLSWYWTIFYKKYLCFIQLYSFYIQQHYMCILFCVLYIYIHFILINYCIYKFSNLIAENK